MLVGAGAAAATGGLGWAGGEAMRLAVAGICRLVASSSAAVLVMLGAGVATAPATGAVGWRGGGACWRIVAGMDAGDNILATLVGGGQGAARRWCRSHQGQKAVEDMIRGREVYC